MTQGSPVAIAAHHGVPPDHVMATAGSSEGIVLAFGALLRPGATVVVPKPVFGFFRREAANRGLSLAQVPVTETGMHDLPAMPAAARKTSAAGLGAMVVVTDPHNPTGTSLPKANLTAFARDLPPDGRAVGPQTSTGRRSSACARRRSC